MPDMLPIAIMSAAPAAPVASAAPVALVSADVQSTAPSFLAQLKAALASLAMPTKVGAVKADVAAVAPAIVENILAIASAPVDEQSEALPDELAALGIIMAPPLLIAPLVPTDVVVQEVPAAETNVVPSSPRHTTLAAVPADAAMPATSDMTPAPASPPTNGPLADVGQQSATPVEHPVTVSTQPTQAAVANTPSPAIDFTAVAQAVERVAPLDDAAIKDLVTKAAPATHQRESGSSTDVFSTDVQPVEVATTPASTGDAPRESASSPVHDTTTVTFTPTDVTRHNAGDHRGNLNDEHPREGRSDSISETTPVQDANLPEAAFAAAVVASTGERGPALTAHVRPAEVVNQIAHQADLYRLPGNRGVRIHLAPEELGGVDVTLRYSAAGNLQLHINVEHAQTAALVQQGWTELRDALATQGITPDRLIMSITAPSTASGLDLSNGNGSFRADHGLANFGQDQSSGQRQGDDRPETRRQPATWAANDTTAATTDEVARAGSATSARIDYRV